MQIILPQGNYNDLLTFKRATVIYDLTYYFVKKYLRKGDRTIDQMLQAARSGKQNIAEGVAASATNSETEIRLVNVAKASMHELLVDYEDYLRTRNLPKWPEDGVENKWVREFARKCDDSESYLEIARKRTDGVIANMSIVLLKLEDYLLFRQLKALEAAFNKRGDLAGRLREASVEIKENRRREAQFEAARIGKKCPHCGDPMVESLIKEEKADVLAWECHRCRHKEKADLFEMMALRKERDKQLWLAKKKFGR